MPLRVYTFKAKEELIHTLDIIAQLEGKTRSELIREAIQKYIERFSRQSDRILILNA